MSEYIIIGESDYKKYLENSDCDGDDYNEYTELDNDLVQVIYYDYANDARDLLEKNKVEFNYVWDANSEGDGGTEYYRFIKGEYKSIYMTDLDKNTLETNKSFLADLKKVIKEESIYITDPVRKTSITKLRDKIKRKIKKIEPFEIKPIKNKIPNSYKYILED